MIGAGPVAEWLSLHTPLQVAQCFVGLDPGHGHGTAHQAMLRQRPTCHNQRHPQHAQLCTGGLWGEEAEKKDWQQVLAQGQC